MPWKVAFSHKRGCRQHIRIRLGARVWRGFNLPRWTFLSLTWTIALWASQTSKTATQTGLKPCSCPTNKSQPGKTTLTGRVILPCPAPLGPRKEVWETSLSLQAPNSQSRVASLRILSSLRRVLLLLLVLRPIKTYNLKPWALIRWPWGTERTDLIGIILSRLVDQGAEIN